MNSPRLRMMLVFVMLFGSLANLVTVAPVMPHEVGNAITASVLMEEDADQAAHCGTDSHASALPLGQADAGDHESCCDHGDLCDTCHFSHAFLAVPDVIPTAAPVLTGLTPFERSNPEPLLTRRYRPPILPSV